MTNSKDALDELKFIKDRGLPGIMLGIFPSGKGHPTLEDDIFYKECLDMKMTITVKR